MSSPIRPLVAAMLAGGALVGAVLPAHAAVIALNYDPDYGSPFADLGWRVTADLYVEPSCVMPAAQPWLNQGGAASASCRQSRLANVVLYFYNLSTPATMVESLDIGSYGADAGVRSDVTDQTQELLELTQNDGITTGFKTSWSQRVQASSNEAGGGVWSFALRLSLALDPLDQAQSNLAQLVHLNTNAGLDPDARYQAGASSSGTVITTAARFNGENADYVPRQRGQFTPTFLQTVPEPGSAALVLAALLAAAAAASRRRRG